MAIIKTVLGKTPQLDQTVFLAETAAITGDVTMGEHSSAFYGVSARGDSAPIAVGARSNLQDNVVLHADEGFPCTIGEDVSVGHAAVVHGATVGDGALIGMNATVQIGRASCRETRENAVGRRRDVPEAAQQSRDA